MCSIKTKRMNKYLVNKTSRSWNQNARYFMTLLRSSKSQGSGGLGTGDWALRKIWNLIKYDFYFVCFYGSWQDNMRRRGLLPGGVQILWRIFRFWFISASATRSGHKKGALSRWQKRRKSGNPAFGICGPGGARKAATNWHLSWVIPISKTGGNYTSQPSGKASSSAHQVESSQDMTLLFPGTTASSPNLWQQQKEQCSTSCFWEAIANKSHLINCIEKKAPTDRPTDRPTDPRICTCRQSSQINKNVYHHKLQPLVASSQWTVAPAVVN